MMIHDLYFSVKIERHRWLELTHWWFLELRKMPHDLKDAKDSIAADWGIGGGPNNFPICWILRPADENAPIMSYDDVNLI